MITIQYHRIISTCQPLFPELLITLSDFAFESRHSKRHFFPLPDLSTKQFFSAGAGLETQGCQSPLSGPIFKVSETLSHLDVEPGRKLPVTFLWYFAAPSPTTQGPATLDLPVMRSWKSRCRLVPPVPGSPSLPPGTHLWSSSGWSWQTSSFADHS